MSGSERISVYNLADLKNTSDDAILNYLNSLKIKQSHTLTDTRLALGYSAFAICAACFYWDYKFGFESTKYYTAAAVVLYSILNGALTLWIWLVEKGSVYEGVTPSGEKISISSSTKKNVPIYNLKVTVSGPKSKPKTIELAEPFSKWFDEQGHFVTKPFQEVFASSIPTIGKLDPKRVRTESQKLMEASPEVLDALLAEDSAVSGGAAKTTATPKSGGRRRKA